MRDGAVLVCRNKKHGHRFLPGGHVEWGESSPQALAREWREELGMDCTVGEFLGVAEQTYGLGGAKVAEISLVFRVESPALAAGAEPRGIEGHIDFEWVPLNRLDEVQLLPKIIRDALPGWLERPSPHAYLAHMAGETLP